MISILLFQFTNWICSTRGFSAFTSDPDQVAFNEEKILSWYEIDLRTFWCKIKNWCFLKQCEDYQFELNETGMDCGKMPGCFDLWNRARFLLGNWSWLVF